MERGGVVAVLPAPSQQSCRRHERQCLEIQSEDGSLDAQLGSGERERGREGRVNHSCGIMHTQTLLRNPLRT